MIPGIFAKVARDYTIRTLPQITVFLDDVYKLPKIDTLYFTRQIVYDQAQIEQTVYPPEGGTAVVEQPEGEVINVNFNLRTLEASFKEKRLHLQAIEMENFLKQKVDAVNKQLARKVDQIIAQTLLDAAATVSPSGAWWDGSTVDPDALEDDILKVFDEMAKSKFWQPKEFRERAVLYVPKRLEAAFTKKVNIYNIDTTVEEFLKKKVADVKYTPTLQNEAIVMFKNDEFGCLFVEHRESPLTYFDENKLEIFYLCQYIFDVKVVPEPGWTNGLTPRIVKVPNIIA